MTLPDAPKDGASPENPDPDVIKRREALKRMAKVGVVVVGALTLPDCKIPSLPYSAYYGNTYTNYYVYYTNYYVYYTNYYVYYTRSYTNYYVYYTNYYVYYTRSYTNYYVYYYVYYTNYYVVYYH